MKSSLRSFVVAGILAAFTGGAAEALPARDPYVATAPLRYEESVDDGRNLLAYDTAGDGRIVEVFGRLENARHIAVVVPGSGHRLDDFLSNSSSAAPRRNGRDLYHELRRQNPDAPVAVVAWLGYDTPERVDVVAARSDRAVPGARDLVRLTRVLPPDAQVSLVCHSYGSVVCGRAVPQARVDDVVVVGSPGMDVGSAADLRTTARVWAVRTADDPIRFVPDIRLGELGHGADPTSREFGARTFPLGSVTGHDSYYQRGSESLTNIARIALGRDPGLRKGDVDV